MRGFMRRKVFGIFFDHYCGIVAIDIGADSRVIYIEMVAEKPEQGTWLPIVDHDQFNTAKLLYCGILPS